MDIVSYEVNVGAGVTAKVEVGASTVAGNECE